MFYRISRILQEPSRPLTLVSVSQMSSFTFFDSSKPAFLHVLDWKLGLSGLVSLPQVQYHESNTDNCVCYTDITAIRCNKKCNLHSNWRVLCLHRFAFATLRWPHLVRPLIPPKLPGHDFTLLFSLSLLSGALLPCIRGGSWRKTISRGDAL